MALKSSIEWTESTWNPITGCNKISPGCKFCYAERMAKRLKAMGSENYKNGFKLTLQEHALTLPLTWKKPQTIFVNSMSDLFHKDVPVSFVKKTFEVMNKADWHRFQVLTKRSDTLLKLNSELNWTENIWMGVSVENQDYTSRVDDLRQTDAHIKFLSIEPLIGRINELDLTNIDWVIVGGESGPGARPIEEEWVVRIKDICKEAKVPFFFKQWGGVNKKKNGRTLKGKIWSEMPKLKRAA
ncbi:MAG: phage Gp37/Gp68 family protein [Ignavibacteria bacterium]|nr:phage Gp37/Gp68 family protein [Ignavibacteria bacterium]